MQYYITEKLYLQLDRSADVKTDTGTNCSLTKKSD